MNQREFDRIVPVAAQRFCELVKSNPATSTADLAEQAWQDAEKFDAAAAKRDPGETVTREPKRTKTTA